jgi:acetyltransferase-like isoleucine patch superfamily enzyme
MGVEIIFRKIFWRYHYIKTMLFYRPFIKKAHGKFLVINPIVFTSRYIIVGENVFIRNNARVEGVVQDEKVKFNPVIQIGDNVSIEQNLHLTCANKIVIGSNTAIAANVTITDINHPYTNISLPPEKQPLQVGEVSIGADCKIYNNAVILPGTFLGKHNVVGANSVVGGIFPDYCIIAGAPAKIVKRYNPETENWEKVDPKGNFINYKL